MKNNIILPFILLLVISCSPTKNGISLRQLIEHGNLSFEFEDVLFSDWNLEKLNAVVFIQNTITKEVYQTGSTF